MRLRRVTNATPLPEFKILGWNRLPTPLLPIQRAAHAETRFRHHVRVDLGGAPQQPFERLLR